MNIIDFRARPNTKEYMKIYEDPSNIKTWQKFGYPKPKAGTLEEFLEQLEINNVEKAVFTGRQSFKEGILVRGITNDYVASCVTASKGRLIGYAGIDPSDAGAVNEVKRAVNELGLSGISLDPDASGIYPNDIRMYPVYEAASNLNVPVVLTTGPLVGRYGNPEMIDRVAEDFPRLTIVCSHGCWPQVTEFVALAYRRENVYLEASIYEFLPGTEPFIQAADTILQDRVIYASAYPFNPLHMYKKLMELPFQKKSLEKILYKNAAHILKLPE